MIETAINRILSLAEPTIKKIDERSYSSVPIHPIKEPTPECINISTLTGLVDYINNNGDDIDLSKLMIHVESYDSVNLVSNFIRPFFQRNHYIAATCPHRTIAFGSWYSLEEFIIVLQVFFLKTEARDNILKIVGNLKDENVTTVADDGVTQNVTARIGIAKVGNVAVPNPVILQPYRTFIEIEQPESQFIFRMRSGAGGGQPQCALFTADGDAWKLTAIQRIRKWLAKELPDIAIIA